MRREMRKVDEHGRTGRLGTDGWECPARGAEEVGEGAETVTGLNGMIIQGDCLSVLKTLETESVQCCVTSPPYWGLRDYGASGQVGLERVPEEYVAKMVEIFSEVRRILKTEGTLWLNLGDSYATGAGQGKVPGGGGQGSRWNRELNKTWQPNRLKIPGLKPKDLVGIPWRVAFALQANGWYLRQDIIWHKPNPMPESVRDRCTKAHEYIFLLSKSERYFFDVDSIKEPASFPEGNRNRKAREIPGKLDLRLGHGVHKIGPRNLRNKRSVWRVTTKPFKGAHFATFPPDLIEPCILAGSKQDDVILDPFFGAGTTGLVCDKLGRRYIGIELNPEYVQIAKNRLQIGQGLGF